MAITPSGPFSVPMHALAELVAASATFQLMVAAANAAEALDHVHYPEADTRVDPETGRPKHERPYAIVSRGTQWGATKVAIETYQYAGDLQLTFERNVADGAEDGPDALLDFQNKIGAILNEMLAKAGWGASPSGTSYFNLTSSEAVVMPDRYTAAEDETDEGKPFYAASFLIGYEG